MILQILTKRSVFEKLAPLDGLYVSYSSIYPPNAFSFIPGYRASYTQNLSQALLTELLPLDFELPKCLMYRA